MCIKDRQTLRNSDSESFAITLFKKGKSWLFRTKNASILVGFSLTEFLLQFFLSDIGGFPKKQ